MYAEEFILIPQKTYAPDEKTASQSQILHSPLINDKSSQLNYIQRFRERNISRDSPPPLNPTSPIPFFFYLPPVCSVQDQPWGRGRCHPFCRSRSHLEEADDTGTPPVVTPSNVVPNLRKRNLSALTDFSYDRDGEAEKTFES